MAKRQEHRRERRRGRSVFDRIGAAGSGAGAGFLQGLTLGGGDELFANSIDMEQAAGRAPVAFTLGSAIGALPWAALGARATAGATRGPISRLAASTALGAAHGGAAGLFGMTPGDMSDEDRTGEALLMAALGAGVGGLSVPATRAAMDVADNMPALMGRQRLEDGTTVQAKFGQGTRNSAPLNVRLAGEGTPEQRAELALRMGLGMDEFEALQRSMRGKLDRHGETFRADDPGMGRTTRSSVDYAAQSPGGRQRLNAQADDMVGDQNRRAADGAKLPKRGSKKQGELAPDVLEGFLKSADRPEYHASWVRSAKALPQRQRYQLAEAMVERMRAVARDRDPQVARAILSEPQFLKKLEALGVTIDKSLVNRRASAQADALRERGREREYPDYASSERGFANIDDRLLAQRAPLNEADAVALLDAAAQGRRSFFTEPTRPADGRVLAGDYEHGARFNPRAYFGGDDSRRNFNFGAFDIDASPTELAILASQPMAALLHGVPSWDDRRLT